MRPGLEHINKRPTLDHVGVGVGRPLNDAQRAPSRQHEERDWVLGIVSHELRNSLTAITLAGRTLVQRPGAATAPQLASRILASAGRMNRIIRDLLDVSKVRLGSAIEIEPGPVDAHELCKKIVGELETAHPERDIRLHCRGDANGCWDADRLEQVVSNLGSNALQYGATDAPVTIVSCADEIQWTLSVHNLGKPIPPATLPRLYDPFERGADTGKGQAARRNLGLGLFIVRQLVLGHRGTIDVTSSAANGTQFMVRLPRDAASP